MKLYLFAAVAAFVKPASSTWTTVYSETAGYGNGAEYDNDPIRTLNLAGLPSWLDGGDYLVRMEWGSGSDFSEFRVPAGSNIFAQTKGDIAIKEYTDSTNDVVIGSDALFCHACVEGGTKMGDTCWGVTAADSTQRRCGCNSGGWSGAGIYYGGYKTPDECGGQGGGFAGPKAWGWQKGNLPSVGLTLMVKPFVAPSVGFSVSGDTVYRCLTDEAGAARHCFKNVAGDRKSFSSATTEEAGTLISYELFSATTTDGFVWTSNSQALSATLASQPGVLRSQQHKFVHSCDSVCEN